MVKKKDNISEAKLDMIDTVSKKEQYPLPDGWLWIPLVDSFENCTDSKRKIAKKDYLEKGDIAIIDQGQVLIGGYTDDIEKEYKGTLPVIIFGDHTRCIKYIDFPFAQGADGIKVLKPKKFFLPKAFYFAFQTIPIPDMGYRRHFPLLKQYIIPVPPIWEQQRIVEKLEKWFYKLDMIQEKIRAVIVSSEKRKAAILHKAFTGELTAKWRERNGIKLESWKKTYVKEICYDVKVGIVIKPAQYYTSKESGIPAFRSANVREFHINDENWVYLNQKGQNENIRSIVHTGDLLIVRSGNPGTACVVTEKFNGYNAIDILIAVPDKQEVLSDFLCAYTNSPDCRQLIEKNKRGMALTHFNVKEYANLSINLPTIVEQIEIVNIVNALLRKEQQIKNKAKFVLEEIKIIRKSILMYAFCGKMEINSSVDISD